MGLIPFPEQETNEVRVIRVLRELAERIERSGDTIRVTHYALRDEPDESCLGPGELLARVSIWYREA